MTDTIAAVLLVLSGVLVLLSAIGFVRPSDFFVRMHPPALAYTGGTWSAAMAGVLVHSTGPTALALQPLIIIVLLFITVPMTSLLLARAVLFRRRSAGADDTPGPLPSARTDDQRRDAEPRDAAGGTSSTSQPA